METTTILIEVDAESAKSLAQVSPAERRKLELLLALRLRELTGSQARPLKEIMDEIGNQAEAKGLTPEQLDTLLRDE